MTLIRDMILRRALDALVYGLMMIVLSLTSDWLLRSRPGLVRMYIFVWIVWTIERPAEHRPSDAPIAGPGLRLGTLGPPVAGFWQFPHVGERWVYLCGELDIGP